MSKPKNLSGASVFLFVLILGVAPAFGTEESSQTPTSAPEAKAEGPKSADPDPKVGDPAEKPTQPPASAENAKPIDPPQPGAIPAPPDVAGPPPEASKTPSGLWWQLLSAGTGSTRPTPTDLVTVHYTGWLSADGRMLDSSVQRGKPLTMVLKRLIPGWVEGLQLMVPGEKRRFWIPESLAFQGNPTAPKGMIVYDIELIDVTPGPETPPPDVAAPPAAAQKTASGLAWKVLNPGHGTRHPSPTSSVTVHYTGWTTDGKMFDSSVVRGTAANFPLNRVIAGWTEGLQLMVEGEKRRLWIPEKLAYRGQTGKPAGTLVFDVELLAIQN